MKITIEASVSEIVHLAEAVLSFFCDIEQEIQTMSGTLQDQLTEAQTQAETIMNDISAKVDAIAAQAGSGQVSQDNVDRANRLVSIAQAVSDKLDAAVASAQPASPPQPAA